MTKPCHGQAKIQSAASADNEGAPYGPIGALLTRLGFAPDHPAGAVLSPDLDNDESRKESTRQSVLEEWRSHVEEILHDAVPILEGGVVRILNTNANAEDVYAHAHEQAQEEDELNDVKWWRVAEGGKWEVKEGNGEWRVPRRGERPPMGKSANKPTRVPYSLLGAGGDEGRHGGVAHAHAHHGKARAHHHRISKTLTGR